MDWSKKSVLITGGTGSFGKKLVEVLLAEYQPKRVIVFSRDELKQYEMEQDFPVGDSPMRYFLGDIRNRERLEMAFRGVDIVIHAAALKQVPACEYNPFEAVLTNVMGAKNIIDAAMSNGTERVLAVSTDKAVNPSNLYGATKLVAEKLFTQGNTYVGERATSFSCSRYGNVVGSRGSVVPLFLKQRETGRVTITHPDMTRFWITREEGVRFVIKCVEQMVGGEIFIPKIPSMRIGDLAEAIAPGCEQEIIGIRPGEKMHEAMLSEEEASHAREFSDMFVVCPRGDGFETDIPNRGEATSSGFQYTSDSNDQWLTHEEFTELMRAGL